MSILTGKNERGRYEEVDVKSKSLCITSGGYKDLGLVIDATNMAAGASVNSTEIVGLEWVRNMQIWVTSDQQYDVYIIKKDSGGTSGAISIATNQAITVGRPHPTIGSNALGSYSMIFQIKNSGAVPNTYGKMRVQLMGL